jgi:hypothetical protein
LWLVPNVFGPSGRGCIKKPTTVCQPWVLVENVLLSTSADGVVTYDDDQQQNLSSIR